MDLKDADSPAYVDRVLFCDREKNRLTLFDLPTKASVEYKVKERYKISVGTAGNKTPRGCYRINTKVKDPAWTRPNSDWVPEALRGTVVQGGSADNPLKERWMGVTEPADGIGIHGTGDLENLGVPASHGCIRMRPQDVIELYEEVPLGTPMVIA